MKQLNALEMLKDWINGNYPSKKDIEEAIKELEELQNKSCNGCKHLLEKEENLKHNCLIEVCRSCMRSNIDRWEQN